MRFTFILFLATLITFSSVHGQRRQGQRRQGQPGPEQPRLYAVLSGDPKFSIFLQFLQDTNLMSTVANRANTTIFIPTDRSFARTGRSLGCTRVIRRTDLINCLNEKWTAADKADLVSYHVIREKLGSLQVFRRRRLRSLNNKQIRRNGLTLIDLNAESPNPTLVLTMLNYVYNNGFLHVINRALLPFIAVDDPCNAIKDPIVGANGEFIPLRKVVRSLWRCRRAYASISTCQPTSICTTRAGAVSVTRRYTVGYIVAAITQCENVANAFSNC